MRLSDYRTKSRIYAGFCSLIVITAAVAGFGYFRLTTIDGTNRAVGETGATASQVLSSAEQHNRQSEALRRDVGEFLERMRAA